MNERTDMKSHADTLHDLYCLHSKFERQVSISGGNAWIRMRLIEFDRIFKMYDIQL